MGLGCPNYGPRALNHYCYSAHHKLIEQIANYKTAVLYTYTYTKCLGVMREAYVTNKLLVKDLLLYCVPKRKLEF